MLRAGRPGDAPAVSELIARAFARGEAGPGWDRRRIADVVRRLHRWDARAILGLLGALGRPVPQTFVEEADGRVRGAVVWSPGRRVAWVAALGWEDPTDEPPVGESLLERAWIETRRRGRHALLVSDATLPGPFRSPDRMRAIGFAEIGTHRWWRWTFADRPPPRATADPPRTIRRPHRSDGLALLRHARAARSPVLERLEPLRASDLTVSPFVVRALGSEGFALVHVGASGPDAQVRATWNPANPFAHLSVILDPTAPSTGTDAVLDRVLDWCWDRGARGAVVEAPEGPGPLPRFLAERGFVAGELWTTWTRQAGGPA